MNEPSYIVSLGASTPIGRDAWSSAAAVRAGISGFAEHPYLDDTAGEPMNVAMAPWLDIDVEGKDRFEALLFPAIDDALHPVGANADGFRIGLAVGLPAPRPGLPPNLEQQLRQAINQRYGRRFADVAMFGVGHAAGVLALLASDKKLTEGSLEGCVVAGVESYLIPETLEWLEESDQLHGAGALNNAWGFIPGEAAGAVMLLGRAAGLRLKIQALGQVLSVGTGTEHNRIKTETVCTGKGLTAAFRQALTALPSDTQVTDVYCDMNGEPYRADEFGFACLRTKAAFGSASDFVAPADCWGDVSAASIPLAMILSSIAGAKSYANGAHSFLWASSESGERGAVLLQVRNPTGA